VSPIKENNFVAAINEEELLISLLYLKYCNCAQSFHLFTGYDPNCMHQPGNVAKKGQNDIDPKMFAYPYLEKDS
jgi:hypothetical protein